VLAITGMQFNDLANTFGQQDVELDKLLMDVACYNNRVMSGAHMEPTIDLAIRTATLPIRIVIIKNNSLGQIKWKQMVFQGNPEYQCELFPIDFVALARAVGADGVRIEDPATAGAKLDEGLATPGPVVIELVVDQFTAMLPAKITPKQAIKFSESLIKGEPNRLRIALTAPSDTVRQIV
jgi:pyruvate dehydrogenase (quinone)